MPFGDDALSSMTLVTAMRALLVAVEIGTPLPRSGQT